MPVRLLCLLLAFSVMGGTLCAQGPSADPGRQVRWQTLSSNLLSDQKHIWLYPTQVVRGRHLWPTLAVVAVTAALVATDAQTAPHFRSTTAFNRFNSVFTSNATDMGVLAAPVLLYAGGFLGKSSYARHTALLAGEAVGDSEILVVIAKDIDRRRRPSSYAPNTNMSDSWFNATGSWLRSNGSFPSGHTIAAFSVATVMARRYPRQRWVPYVAYGLAAVVGFSRLTLSAHFPSDVFVGGALGYSISRFAVLQQ
jgi:membrane-associated phospholipid phosphatase